MNALDHTARMFRNPTLAESILAGDIPHADWPIFTAQEWEREAQSAIDWDDDTDLLAMIAEQEQADLEEEAARRAEYSGKAPNRRSWLTTPRCVAGMVSQ